MSMSSMSMMSPGNNETTGDAAMMIGDTATPSSTDHDLPALLLFPTPTPTVELQPTTTMISSLPFQQGEIIPQIWHPFFIFFAFFVALVSSYSAIRLLDHSIWRAEQGKEVFVSNTILIKHPDVICAILLGFGTVWSMHFIGMSAVSLKHVPTCYNWGLTLASLLGAVAAMGWAVSLARQDIFAGPDRIKLLKRIVINDKQVNRKTKANVGFLCCKTNAAQFAVHKVAFCHKLDKILLGSVAAASGALLMHYTGMLAVRGPFQRVWRTNYIVGSVVLGLVICAVGFWIIFRLGWKVDQAWTRPISAAVIATAVCILHFFGMLSIEYTYDENLRDVCSQVVDNQQESPTVWTGHQCIDLAVGVIVPTVALWVETVINREILMAYCKETGFSLKMVLANARSASNANNSKSNCHVSGLGDGSSKPIGQMDSSWMSRGRPVLQENPGMQNRMVNVGIAEETKVEEGLEIPQTNDAPTEPFSLSGLSETFDSTPFDSSDEAFESKKVLLKNKIQSLRTLEAEERQNDNDEVADKINRRIEELEAEQFNSMFSKV